MSTRAALFDMDRTLVRVNTAPLYVRWQLRVGEARRRDLAARAAVAMRGREEAEFRERVRAWVDAEVLQHVGVRAREEVARRRAEGYLCAVLTGSTGYTAEPLARALGIEHVLASRLEVVDGRFTGLHVAPLCYGAGKVTAADAWARAHDVDLSRSVFYSDSISDLPMLERVGEPVVVNPDPRLRLAAMRRRWRVEKWT